MAKLLGIDVGTSGCKAILIDEQGRVLKQATAGYPLSVPKPNWSEQDPEDWWAAVQQTLDEIGTKGVDAIGLTGQMHGSVFLDGQREVLRPAILWNDQRTAVECEEIDRLVGKERVREITRNPPLTGFQAPKVLWLRRHEPEVFARVGHVLLPKDFIRFRLTGALASDVSDASGTGLFDVARRRWSSQMMETLDLPQSLFPDSNESFVVSATTKSGIPVVSGAGDQAAAAVGTGAVRPGIVSVSLGTSGVVFTAIDDPSYDPAGATHTFCHANGGWHAMGVTLNCGGALKWYRDTFRESTSYDQLATEAASVAAGCEGLTFLPYLTGERCPINDPLARGAFAGISLVHRRAHFTRAVFEGASFALLEAMDALRGLGASASDVRVTSGGARSPFWVQLLADLFGASCTTLEVDEGPAFGAAILAGVGVGIWPDVPRACSAVVRKKSEIRPSGVRYEEFCARFRELYASTKGLNKS